MYGVVLWSDPRCNNAVIWCEDQRGLAYYEADRLNTMSDLLFNPGDLVEFDVAFDNERRVALNAKGVTLGLSDRRNTPPPEMLPDCCEPFSFAGDRLETENVILLAAHRPEMYAGK